MTLLTIKLNSGLEIEADTCHISSQSFPTDSAENLDKAYLRPVSPRMYEDVPYVVINCEVIDLGGNEYRLPRYRLMAAFSSAPLECHLPKPEPTSFDASFLTIIWLQNETHPIVSSENRNRISAIDWPNLAKNGFW